MRRTGFVGAGLAAVFALSLLVALNAAASGRAETKTKHFHDKTQTMKIRNPCTGEHAQVTITYDGVRHTTFHPGGRGHFNESQHGTFALDTLVNGQPDGDVDASGRFTNRDTANGQFDQHGDPVGRAEFSFTLNGRGTNADDGTTFNFHQSSHGVTDASGAEKLFFAKAHCHQ